jgi:hypothetical protein
VLRSGDNETALQAAQFAKSKTKDDIIELRDCATGEKLVMLAVWQGELDAEVSACSG